MPSLVQREAVRKHIGAAPPWPIYETIIRDGCGGRRPPFMVHYVLGTTDGGSAFVDWWMADDSLVNRYDLTPLEQAIVEHHVILDANQPGRAAQ